MGYLLGQMRKLCVCSNFLWFNILTPANFCRRSANTIICIYRVCNQIKHHPYMALMQDTVDQMICRGDNCLNEHIHFPILMHLLDEGDHDEEGTTATVEENY